MIQNNGEYTINWNSLLNYSLINHNYTKTEIIYDTT